MFVIKKTIKPININVIYNWKLGITYYYIGTLLGILELFIAFYSIFKKHSTVYQDSKIVKIILNIISVIRTIIWF